MDPLEAYLEGCAQPFTRGFLFFSAVWAGLIPVGFAIGSGYLLMDPVTNWDAVLKYILIAPIFLLSRYAILNAFFSLIAIWVFIKTEWELWWLWATVAFAQSLFGMLGFANRISGSLWITAAIWIVWLISISTVTLSAFFIRQWQRNRWGAQMAQLKAQNAERRAELAKRGIATFDPDPSNDY